MPRGHQKSTVDHALVCELSVRLEHVEPAVWRDLLVPGTDRPSRIADILLIAMGWNNSHLHQFLIGDARFGMHADDWEDDEIDEATVSLLEPSEMNAGSYSSTTSATAGNTRSTCVRSRKPISRSPSRCAPRELAPALLTTWAAPMAIGSSSGRSRTPNIPNTPTFSSGQGQPSTDRPSTSPRQRRAAASAVAVDSVCATWASCPPSDGPPARPGRPASGSGRSRSRSRRPTSPRSRRCRASAPYPTGRRLMSRGRRPCAPCR